MLANPAKSMLLVIDIQDRLCSAMPEKVVQQVQKNTLTLIEAATTLGIPLAHTEQYPKGLGPTNPQISDAINEPAYEKTCFSALQGIGPEQNIQSVIDDPAIEQVILTGMETHVCVLQTAFNLLETGKQIFVVADAVCSRKKIHFKNALARMQQAGIIISNTESVLFEWLKDAQHPEFKALSKLIR